MDLLRKIAESVTLERNPYIGEGKYLLEVVNLKIHDGFKGQSFVGTHKVIEASEGSKNAVGDTVSFLTKLDDKHEMGIKKLKTYMCALLGLSSKTSADIVEKELTRFIDFGDLDPSNTGTHAQPAKGALIRCTAVDKVSEKGVTFTNYTWETVPDSEQPA